MKKTVQIKSGSGSMPVFNSLPQDWEWKYLGELGTFAKGKGITKEQLTETGLPCIRYGEIYTTHDSVVRDFHSFISKQVAKESQEIKTGDILFAGSGETVEEIGKAVAYIGKEKAYAGGDVVILSPYNVEDAGYISYALNTAIANRQKRRLGQGQQVVHIYPTDLAQVRIPYAPYKYRIAIPKILSSWDDAVFKTQKLVARKEQQLKWLMQALLVGKKRLKGFKEQKWTKYNYEDILLKVKRPVVWNDNARYNLISVRRNSGGIFSREPLFGHQIKVKNLRTAQTGDFLFSKMQILHGAAALVTEQFDGMKISGSYIAVISKDDKVLNMEFLWWYSKMPYFYYQTFISSYGVAIEKMTFEFEYFLQLTIKLPSVKEQEAIIRILKLAEAEIRLLRAKVSKLEIEKKGLMQQLLTGRKRLNKKQ